MRYYRCACGKNEAFGSMSPARCYGCASCGTTLDESPTTHEPTRPHRRGDIEWRINGQTGERWPVRVCMACHDEERVLRSIIVDGTPFYVNTDRLIGAQIRAIARIEPTIPLFRILSDGSRAVIGDGDSVTSDAEWASGTSPEFSTDVVPTPAPSADHQETT